MTEIKNKEGKLIEYQIGDSISIHRHIHYPESWMLTIRPLAIFGQELCKVTCTKDEIARHLHVVLRKKLLVIESLIKEIILFT